MKKLLVVSALEYTVLFSFSLPVRLKGLRQDEACGDGEWSGTPHPISLISEKTHQNKTWYTEPR